MTQKYTIYSDESGSDKSLNNRDEYYLNFDLSNNFRNYVRSYISVSTDDVQDIENNLIDLEKKYFSQNYMDGKEIHAKDKIKISGNKGIENLGGDTIKFMEGLLNICEKITVYIFTLNKMEYIVQNSIKVVKKNLVTKEEVIYSLTKLFQNQQTEELMKILFSQPTSITKKKFLDALKEIEDSLKNKKLKSTELRAVKDIITLVKKDIIQILPQNSYKWDYEFEVINFLNLLKTDSIKIIFDEGNDIKNVMDVKKESQSIVTMTNNSAIVPGLRIADWFATFFGKLLRSISEALKVKDGKINKANNETVLDLPYKWFNLNYQQFNLCKNIKKCIENNQIRFEVGNFADDLLFLLGYLKFIGDFETYEEFSSVQIEDLSKKYNMELTNIWHYYYSQQNIEFNPNELMSGILSDKVFN